LNFSILEEDIFNLAAAQPPAQPPAQRNLTIAGCRILARQFRERVASSGPESTGDNGMAIGTNHLNAAPRLAPGRL
jgi:hypothetical protein